MIIDEDMVPTKTEKGNAYRFKFEILPESRREELTLELITIGGQILEKEERLTVAIKEEAKRVTTDVISMEHTGYKLIRIDNIEDFDVLEEIKNAIVPLGRNKVDGVVSGRVKARFAGGEMELNVKNMDLEVGIEASIKLAMYGEEEGIAGKYTIEFRGTVLDELIIRKLENLNRKVKFTLEVRLYDCSKGPSCSIN